MSQQAIEEAQRAKQQATRIAELEAGKDELLRLMDGIWRAEFRRTAPNWKPLPDLIGMVTQIDNMYAGVREQRDEARSCIAELETALRQIANRQFHCEHCTASINMRQQP
jgi:hypothetical protein